MKMTNYRLLDERDFRANLFVAPKKRQGSRIMAKEQDSLAGLQRHKCLPYLHQMTFAQLLPFRPLLEQGIRLKRGAMPLVMKQCPTEHNGQFPGARRARFQVP